MSDMNSGHPAISHAFDTVWHRALLSKLSAYDIQGQLHTWLSDFLDSRSQCVALKGILSSLLPVKVGVPQISVPDHHQLYLSDSGKSSVSIC